MSSLPNPLIAISGVPWRTALVTCVAWCLFAGASACRAADGQSPDSVAAEQRLLGGNDEDARYLVLRPFSREFAQQGGVGRSLGESLEEAGVPAVVAMEVRRAISGVIDEHRVGAVGDRFYVRWTQTFTTEGVPLGVGRLLWAELDTRARGKLAFHRFRPAGGSEGFWLESGESVAAPPLRLPLESIAISSGFGMRVDPFDRAPAAIARLAPAGGPPPSRVGGKGIRTNAATRLGASLGLAPQPGLQAHGSHGPRGSQALAMHQGVDLVSSTGTPVYAAADGVVAGAAPNGGYGNWIRIDHAGNRATVYGHLSAFAPGVEPGVSVSQGALIGFVGSTGRSTGPHLHFEIWNAGTAVDPMAVPEIRRLQLRGADLERFRRQVDRERAEREREAPPAASGEHFAEDWNLVP